MKREAKAVDEGSLGKIGQTWATLQESPPRCEGSLHNLNLVAPPSSEGFLVDAGGLYLRVFLGQGLQVVRTGLARGEHERLEPPEQRRWGEVLPHEDQHRRAQSRKRALVRCAILLEPDRGPRLAVAAHEFGHVLGDGGERMRRLVVPAVAVSVLFALAVVRGDWLRISPDVRLLAGFTGAVASAVHRRL